MTMILEGIRVIDWTVYHAGPSAGAMLGDLGAEVIKLEPPDGGDLMRGLATHYGVDLILKGGRQAIFEDVNRNKKGLAVDIRRHEGREIVHQLVKKSDVFLTNYRPKAAKSVGLDYDTLRKLNPRLIYGIASGFGDRGPLAEQPCVDLTGLAFSGTMLSSGDEGMPPVQPTSSIADRIVGIYLAYGIIAALLARERLGIGQEVKVSQIGSLNALQSVTVIIELLTGISFPRPGRVPKGNPLYAWYRCQDDRWLAFGVPHERYWPTFCRGLGRPDLENDPRFADAKARAENSDSLAALLDEIFATRPAEEWERRFREAGDIIFSRVNTIGEAISHPQMLENEYIVDWDHPVLGRVKAIGFPVAWGATPAKLRFVAPELGQHNEEILTEVLGYSWEEITELKDKRVIL